MEYIDLQEYESLRVIGETHKLRHSHHHKLVNSGPGQTLMLSERGGYMTFRVVESGLEIPVFNVASAIPKGVSLATKRQKTTREKLTPKLKAPRKATPPTEEPDDG